VERLARLGQRRVQYTLGLAQEHIRGQTVLLDRVVENLTEFPHYVRRDVTLTFALPSPKEFASERYPISEMEAAPGTIFPLLILRRGALIADLEVRDSRNRILPILQRYDSRALSMALLFGPLQTPIGDVSFDDPQGPAARLFQMIGRDKPLGAAEVEQAALDLAVKHALPITAFKRLIETARFLREHYIQWVDTDFVPGVTSLLRYSYRAPLQPTVPSWHPKGRADRFRGPYLLVEVPSLTLAPSFHLRAEPPEGHYVAEQEFILQTDEVAKPSRLEALWGLIGFYGPPITPTYKSLSELCKGLAHVRIYDRVRGLRGYVHLYALNVKRADLRGQTPWVRIRTAERPPGASGAAFTVGLVVFALLWLSFWVNPANLGTASTDSAVVAVGVPGLIAVWLQSAIGGPAKGHVRRLTRALLTTSAIGSLLGVGYLTWVSVHDGDAPLKWWAILIASRWTVATAAAALILLLSLQLVRLCVEILDYARRTRIGIDEIAVPSNIE
jgi:hypothetical protein